MAINAKRWILLFLLSVLLAAASLVGFNVLTDPFGLFGDPLLDWYSYNMTQNPRTAKIGWLQKGNHEKFDSYIIGCSGSSSIPVEPLNEALDASFYNMIMYGADLADVELTARWLADNCEVKNLVVSLYLENAVTCGEGEGELNHQLHPAVSGDSSVWLDYLLLPPRHGMEKLRARFRDTELPQVFDVFNVETGVYDKRLRDVEPISIMEEYLAAYPVFVDYPAGQLETTALRACVKHLTAIRDLCTQRGINLIVVQNPVYADYLDYYDRGELAALYEALAEVTPFWDFAYSSISCEPRYFYDATHFRNTVGEMMIARMFDDESVWLPEDFGQYVTAETVSAHIGRFDEALAAPAEDYTAQVPILLYHALDETGEGDASVTPETFRSHMEALQAAGYTTVSPRELYDYVNCGGALPEKPVLITFDDGYASNYEIAYPVLKELGMKAMIFAIGVSVGKDFYKDTEHAMTPHFGWEEAREMVASGLIDVCSHTYDLHQWPPFEPEGKVLRENVLPLEGESEADYAATFTADLGRSVAELEAETGERCLALAWPHGKSAEQSWVLAKELGIPVTVSTVGKTNEVIRGLPQSLMNMGRYPIDDISAEELLTLIEA